ncbi:MAG: hypothetical protein JSR60_04105 [Proteobacteria bacterium]|nr:hypothetical protein [Pseudomonadota bacterium]
MIVTAPAQSTYACLKGTGCECAAPGPDCNFSYEIPSPAERLRGWLTRVWRAIAG